MLELKTTKNDYYWAPSYFKWQWLQIILKKGHKLLLCKELQPSNIKDMANEHWFAASIQLSQDTFIYDSIFFQIWNV